MTYCSEQIVERTTELDFREFEGEEGVLCGLDLRPDGREKIWLIARLGRKRRKERERLGDVKKDSEKLRDKDRYDIHIYRERERARGRERDR